jgi:hypothetical protein
MYGSRGDFSMATKPDWGEVSAFLNPEQREALTTWWLAVRERANTPNWDIVSTCQMVGRQGLVLVEAKAHAGELHRARAPATH